jgi:hypothetical protein
VAPSDLHPAHEHGIEEWNHSVMLDGALEPMDKPAGWVFINEPPSEVFE